MKQKDGTVQKAGCLDFWVAPGLTYCFCGMGVWKLRIRDIAGDDSCTEEFGKGYHGTHRTVWFESEEKTKK